MNNETRLNNISKKAKPRKKIAVFFYDLDNVNLYDKPYHEEGAQLVTPEQLRAAQAEGMVILFCNYDLTPETTS